MVLRALLKQPSTDNLICQPDTAFLADVDVKTGKIGDEYHLGASTSWASVFRNRDGNDQLTSAQHACGSNAPGGFHSGNLQN